MGTTIQPDPFRDMRYMAARRYMAAHNLSGMNLEIISPGLNIDPVENKRQELSGEEKITHYEVGRIEAVLLVQDC